MTRDPRTDVVMGVLMVNEEPPTGYRHTAEVILARADAVDPVREAARAVYDTEWDTLALATAIEALGVALGRSDQPNSES